MGDTARGRGCAQEAGARGVQEAVERHSAPWIWPLIIQMLHLGDMCSCCGCENLDVYLPGPICLGAVGEREVQLILPVKRNEARKLR